MEAGKCIGALAANMTLFDERTGEVHVTTTSSPQADEMYHLHQLNIQKSRTMPLGDLFFFLENLVSSSAPSNAHFLHHLSRASIANPSLIPILLMILPMGVSSTRKT
jgi:hypothetical protein